MSGKSSRTKAHFLSAFILLSLDTILLLVLAILFFTYAPVWLQLSAWINQVSAGTSAFHIAQQPSSSMMPTLAVLNPTSTPYPLSSLPLDQVAAQADLNPEPVMAGPTLEPVYQIVEELPPGGNLVIPSLGIDQPLTPIAVREQVWDLSNLGTNVGWLQTTGTYPGDDRAMVLIGHITLPYPGGSGPFLNLRDLQPGEIVKYRTSQETYVYQVKGRAVVSPEMVDSLYQADGNSLLLVTCTGYNVFERKYDRRLLVEAVLVGVESGGSVRFSPSN